MAWVIGRTEAMNDPVGRGERRSPSSAVSKKSTIPKAWLCRS